MRRITIALIAAAILAPVSEAAPVSQCRTDVLTGAKQARDAVRRSGFETSGVRFRFTSLPPGVWGTTDSFNRLITIDCAQLPGDPREARLLGAHEMSHALLDVCRYIPPHLDTPAMRERASNATEAGTHAFALLATGLPSSLASGSAYRENADRLIRRGWRAAGLAKALRGYPIDLVRAIGPLPVPLPVKAAEITRGLYGADWGECS